MEKLCYILIIGLLASEALSMSMRNKRQVNDDKKDLEDRYGWNRYPQGQRQFPNQDEAGNQGQIPNQGQPPNQGQIPQQPNPQQPGVSNGNPNTGGTQQTYQDCIRRCPVTSEYNPVCGTDNVTYDNPGRLQCAQNCGTNVRHLRTSRCPPAVTAAPS